MDFNIRRPSKRKRQQVSNEISHEFDYQNSYDEEHSPPATNSTSTYNTFVTTSDESSDASDSSNSSDLSDSNDSCHSHQSYSSHNSNNSFCNNNDTIPNDLFENASNDSTSLTVNTTLQEFFTSLCDEVAPALLPNVSAKDALFMTAMASAKQRYNLSNNAVTFILRCCGYFTNDLQLPLNWKNIINKLTILKPYSFVGCFDCGRYIFEVNDSTCKVCNSIRNESKVLYIPVMSWLKLLYAYSPSFIANLIEITCMYK